METKLTTMLPTLMLAGQQGPVTTAGAGVKRAVLQILTVVFTNALISFTKWLKAVIKVKSCHTTSPRKSSYRIVANISFCNGTCSNSDIPDQFNAVQLSFLQHVTHASTNKAGIPPFAVEEVS
jgi:hypothetical protein